MTTKTGDKTKKQIVADANIDKVQWNKNLNYHALKAIKTANDYVPTTSADWQTAPTTIDAALDELGDRSNHGAEENVANVFTENQTLANAKSLILKELTTNGTGSVSVKAPDAVSGNTAFTLTLPAANDTLATLGMTETITGIKTFSGANVHYDSLKIQDGVTTPKAIKFVAGGSVSTTTTITSSQTVNRALALPDAAGTIALTSDIGAAVFAVAEVALTQAEIVGLYATSKALVAAPAAGHILIVDAVEVLHTYAVAAYADGGAVVVQYASTANGAGVEAAPIAAANVTDGASSNTRTEPAAQSEFDMVANKAKGLYLSNKTGAFTAGDAGNVIKVRVYYRDIILVA